jgi:MFS superfamily sulfate permease-like transporter
MSMPHVLHQISFADDSFHHQAALALGLATLFIYLAWQYWVPQRYRVVPGSLVAVVFGTVFAIWLDLPVNTIRIPDNVLSSLPVGEVFRHLDRLLDTHVWATILGLAMVCSAETLLDAIAIDKIVPGHRTNFNKDLMAQGLGNVLCGLLGAMPVSGVIVRSVANVNAGARTRVSTILLGLWLLVSVAFFPALLRMIPTASLAAILLYVSFKLMHFREIPKLARQGRSEMVIYAATLLTIVLHDPLGGVVVGLLLSLLKLLVLFSHLEIDVRQIDDGRERHITLYGVATFIRLPQLAATLDRLPNDADVHIHLEHVTYIDQACLELLENWEQAHQMQGGRLHICWETVDHRTASPILKLKRQLDAQEAGRLTRFA